MGAADGGLASESRRGVVEMAGVLETIRIYLCRPPWLSGLASTAQTTGDRPHGKGSPAQVLDFGTEDVNHAVARQVVWPTYVKSTTLKGAFNQDITGLAWPTYLKSLTLGGYFN